MDTTSVHVLAFIPSPRPTVYRALSDQDVHSAFTGSRSRLDPRPDGSFSYFDGAIEGVYMSVDVPDRFVQRLHAADWPDRHYATVTTTLSEAEDGLGTIVTVEETGVPKDAVARVTDGWSGYWASLARFLANEKKDVVRRFVEEYKNRHNIDVVDDLVHEDCRIHIPLPGLPQGREGMRVNGRMVTDAFPDVQVTREFLLSEGDIVMERAVAEATHQGELMGVAGTGQPVRWTELHAYRVEDGLITEVWSEPDLLRILTEIGAVHLPAD